MLCTNIGCWNFRQNCSSKKVIIKASLWLRNLRLRAYEQAKLIVNCKIIYFNLQKALIKYIKNDFLNPSSNASYVYEETATFTPVMSL